MKTRNKIIDGLSANCRQTFQVIRMKPEAPACCRDLWSYADLLGQCAGERSSGRNKRGVDRKGRKRGMVICKIGPVSSLT